MTPAKRLSDILLALALCLILAVPFGLLMVWLLLRQGRPVFYVSERMRSPTRGFSLWKLRTMTPNQSGSIGATGGDKSSRITPIGHFLRQSRLDEIPQLWNVLRGDMSFVGPRPPLREFVERFPSVYAQVLKSRPGITGLATLTYHRHEANLLAHSASRDETDAIYVRRCIPRKAQIDLIYQRNRSICMDFSLMLQTLNHALVKRRQRRAART